MKQEQPLNETRAGCYPAKREAALIWIRATSRLAGYYLALVSFKGCSCFMPMDLSGLLRRLLTDSHIYFCLLYTSDAADEHIVV